MSRATGQLTKLPQHIFITPVVQPDGTLKHVMSSQKLSDQSVRVNRRGNSGALFLLMTICSSNNIERNNQPICVDIWKEALSYSLGFSQDGDDLLTAVGNYAVAIRRPSMFQQIEMNPHYVVDAAMRGQEGIVLNILSANPSYLLKKAEVMNSVGVIHEVTPLQAAVMTNDVQMMKQMKEHFERLTTDLDGKPIDGLREMYNQLEAIYKQSLQRYCDIQKAEIAHLNEEKNNGQKVDHILLRAENQYKKYTAALESHDLEKLIATHDQAQIDNTFDFQPYIQAICDINLNNRSQKQELDDVMALIKADTVTKKQAAIAKGVSPIEIGFTDQDGKTYTRDEVQALPFSSLTLLQKMNRFREEFVKHMQQELIFNPNHILYALKKYRQIFNDFRIKNFILYHNRDKINVIFSQLLGWAQRNAAEPVRQDIRQGTWYLVKEKEPRRRQSLFNHGIRSLYPDVSLTHSLIVDGIGYTFAEAGGAGFARCSGGELDYDAFPKLMLHKNDKLLKLAEQVAQGRERNSGCGCAVS